MDSDRQIKQTELGRDVPDGGTLGDEARKAPESLAPIACPAKPGLQPVVHHQGLLPLVAISTGIFLLDAVLVLFATRLPPSAQLPTEAATPAPTATPTAALAPVAAEAVLPDPLPGFDLASAAWASDAVEPDVSACLANWIRPVPVKATITLAASGHVTSVIVQEPDVADAIAKRCVGRAYRSIRLASFDGDRDGATFVKAFVLR